nr:transposase [uncultured Lactobacillus sp.]
MDRGYTGFNMIENCNRLKNCNYIIRTKANNGAIKEIQALPQQECDQLIQCHVTTSGHYYETHRQEPHLHWLRHFNHQYKEFRSKNTQDSRWDFEQFCWIKFRACKVKINDPESGKETWEVLITNLDRNEFPISRIKELYHLRWGNREFV